MPLTGQQLEKELGSFHYEKLPGDAIRIEQSWIDANLTYIDTPWSLPVGGGGFAARIRCHKRVARQLLDALKEISEQGLTDLIQTYDGAWAPRLVRGGASLSHHSWGCAFDFNASELPLGSDKQQDPRLVEIMARHGFECGQVWQHRKDPMHFEAIRFLTSESAPASSLDQISVLVGDTKIAAGRLEAGHVVCAIAPIVQALGHTVTWDGANRRLLIR